MQNMPLDIDPAILTKVVRRAQESPAFEIADWTMRSVSHKGTVNPDGLLCFTGTGRDERGLQSWSVVLKIVRPHPLEGGPEHRVHWQREYHAYQSGLLNQMPGPIKPVNCFHASLETDGAWLWLEHLVDNSDDQWTWADYLFAADQLGQSNGACLVADFSPDFPWLSRWHVRDWLSFGDFAGYWQIDSVRAAFSSREQRRLEKLAAESEQFLTILERLPRVFSHFDYKRSNIFVRQRSDHEREIVLVDWADCGIQALGGDLVFLVGASTWFCDWDVARVQALSDAALVAYIQGLQAAGWRGDERQIRLAYWLWLGLYFGLVLPSSIDWVQNPANRADALRMFHPEPETLPGAWHRLCIFALDCADQARDMMIQLRLSGS